MISINGRFRCEFQRGVATQNKRAGDPRIAHAVAVTRGARVVAHRGYDNLALRRAPVICGGVQRRLQELCRVRRVKAEAAGIDHRAPAASAGSTVNVARRVSGLAPCHVTIFSPGPERRR